MRQLDVRKLKRAGLLKPGVSFSWQWFCGGKPTATIGLRTESDRVLLDYRSLNPHSGEWEPMSYEVRLDWTQCGFGGRRAWWRCPTAGCGRRVALLHGGRVFACRLCHQLAYRSQSETEGDRAMRRANMIRKRLGWQPGVLNGSGPKPRGMHWTTFERLEREHAALLNASLAAMATKIGSIHARLSQVERGMKR